VSEFLVLQHIECEDLGTIANAMSQRGIGYKYVRLFDGEPVPYDPGNYSGMIILGGPMNVYEEDKFPYLKDEDILIKKAVKNDMPVLGICLGGQLIAKATGAKVKKGTKKEIGWYDLKLTKDSRQDKVFNSLATGAKVSKGTKKEIGWYDLKLTKDSRQDKVFNSLPGTIKVFQWHGDTFDIPDGAVHLAGSELFSNQAYRVGSSIYGLQFHLEVTQEMINRWISEYEEELSTLDYINAGRIISDTPAYIDNLNRCAELFFDKFFE